MDSCLRSSGCNGKRPYIGTGILVHSTQHTLFDYGCSCCSRPSSTFNRGSKGFMFRQVLMHLGGRLMIRLPTPSKTFSIKPISSTSHFVNGVDISQLGIRITILAYPKLSASLMRKPHVPTLRAHVQQHLSLFVCAFQYIYSSSGCSLPPIQICTRHPAAPCKSSAIPYHTTLIRPTNQLAKIHSGISLD